jgi:sulfur carrier protein ThiS
MKINVIYEGQKQLLELDELATAYTLVEKLNIPPDSVIVISNGVVTPIDSKLYDGDIIQLIKVASGG